MEGTMELPHRLTRQTTTREQSFQGRETILEKEIGRLNTEIIVLTGSLKKTRSELACADEQINLLKLSKDEAVEMLKSCQSEWETTKKSNEILQRRVAYLEGVNMELLAQNISSTTITNEELEKLPFDRRLNSTSFQFNDISISTTEEELLKLRSDKQEGDITANALTLKAAKIEAQRLPLLSKKFEDTSKLSDWKESKRSVTTMELDSEDASRQNDVDLTEENETINFEEHERDFQPSSTIAVQASMPGSVAAFPPKTSDHKRRKDDHSDSFISADNMQVKNLSAPLLRDDSMVDDVVMADIGNNQSSDNNVNNPDIVDTMSPASSGIGESLGTDASSQAHQFISQLTAAAEKRETEKDVSVTTEIESGDGRSEIASEGPAAHKVQTIDHQQPSDSYQQTNKFEYFKSNKTKDRQQSDTVERQFQCVDCGEWFKFRPAWMNHFTSRCPKSRNQKRKKHY